MKLNNQFDPPESDELEVSVFGPGYGEALALHIGAGTWVLVDSCIRPDTEGPASLGYLRGLDVDVDTSVKLVVATHWHADHVRGISEVFSGCRSARLVISGALNSDEFAALTALHSTSMMKSSALEEFVRVFEILEERKERRARFNPPVLASADKLLYRDSVQLSFGIAEARVVALSPSESALLQAALAFARLMPRTNDNRNRIASPAPNHSAVVLWVEVGDEKILLGADMERTEDPKTGWSVILDGSTAISGKADVFKIPHHGSENAHHGRVWSDLLVNDVSAALTPFRRGRLPSPKDIERISSLTTRAYATAPAQGRTHRWRNRVVRDFVRAQTRDIRNAIDGWGHVRFRKKIGDAGSSWAVELYGDAPPLSR